MYRSLFFQIHYMPKSCIRLCKFSVNFAIKSFTDTSDTYVNVSEQIKAKLKQKETTYAPTHTRQTSSCIILIIFSQTGFIFLSSVRRSGSFNFI